MLYQLRRKDFYNIVKEEPNTIIYTYTGSHLNRLYNEIWGFETQVFYKLTKNKNLKESYFVPGKFPLYGFFAKEIRRAIAEKKLKNDKQSYEFMLKHFEESEKEVRKHWKNANFVIFVYSATDKEKEILKKIKNNGFNIIFLDEISKINISTLEYQVSKTDAHPNEKAWDTIVPLLVQKLNL